jgi:hypothetical protein
VTKAGVTKHGLRGALLALCLVTGPAVQPVLAQSFNIMPDKPSKTPDEIERERAAERQYKESLKAIPDKKGSSDPWGGVRNAEPPKQAPKSTAASKSGGTATRQQ